jgi:hypothetical protein
MRALQVLDHSEKPVFLDRSIPTLAPNQILIRTAACALNFADLLMIRGTYQETPALPFTLGMEVAALKSPALRSVIASLDLQALAAWQNIVRSRPRVA